MTNKEKLYLAKVAATPAPIRMKNMRGDLIPYQDYAGMHREGGHDWVGRHGSAPKSRPTDFSAVTPLNKHQLNQKSIDWMDRNAKRRGEEVGKHVDMGALDNPWTYSKNRMHFDSYRQNPKAYEAWRADPENAAVPEGIAKVDDKQMQRLADYQHGYRRHDSITNDSTNPYATDAYKKKQFQQKLTADRNAATDKIFADERKKNEVEVKAPTGMPGEYTRTRPGYTTQGELDSWKFNTSSPGVLAHQEKQESRLQELENWDSRSKANKWWSRTMEMGEDPRNNNRQQRQLAEKKRGGFNRWARSFVNPSGLIDGATGIVNDVARVGSAAVGASDGKNWDESTAWMKHNPETQGSFVGGLGRLATNLATEPLNTAKDLTVGEGAFWNWMGGAGALKGLSKGKVSIPKPQPGSLGRLGNKLKTPGVLPVRGQGIATGTMNLGRNTVNTAKHVNKGVKKYRKVEDVLDTDHWGSNEATTGYSRKLQEYNPFQGLTTQGLETSSLDTPNTSGDSERL